LTQQQDAPAGSSPPRGGRLKLYLSIAGGVAVALAVGGVVSRGMEETRLAERTKEQALPTVKLVSIKAGSGELDLPLPGDVQAFYEARLRARVNGYLKDWKYDIGAKVKAGEVLATIYAPEVQQELDRAKGDLARAEAQGQLAKITSKRWAALRASTAVSQQSVDEKSGEYQARTAEVDATRANVGRLQTLKDYLQIVAPFAGVVTARNVDIGALVGPDDKREMFAVADIHQVRVYVGVPQSYAAQIANDMPATLRLPQYPGREFQAKVLTTSNAIHERSRTLLVQLIADNPDGALLPGSYAEVHFKLRGSPQVVRIPANAILYRDSGLAVATVGADGKILVKPIDVSRDLGAELEVWSGLKVSDRVVQSPSEMLRDGDEVRIADAAAAPKPGETK
jgi:RND family efflux transporter MFP subunit